MAQIDFHKEKIVNWKEIHRYQKEGWVYRGQKKSTWGLETTLERACKNYGEHLKDAKIIEKALLREFRRKYHQYSMQSPEDEDLLEWFSLMQHYGAPTRLLDFTYSIYVAAYFALEEAEGECAVWAINGKWAVRRSGTLFKRKSLEWKYLKKFIEEEKERAFESVFRGDVPKKFACPQNPFRLNERLTAQKGVFMCPGDVTKRFETNLRALLKELNDRRNIMQILIPLRLRKDALTFLSNINVTHKTLFPDLGGFAHSLKVSLPVSWELIGR